MDAPRRRRPSEGGSLDPTEFGVALTALRSPLSLRALEKRQELELEVVLGRSTLSRYEAGQLPPLKYADHLDHLYDGNGWVSLNLRNLWLQRWDPWVVEQSAPRALHALSWPAPYAGRVWMKLVPEASSVGDLHSVTLTWGPWCRRVVERIGAGGLVLTTIKAEDADGHPVTATLECDRRVFALWGGADVVPEGAVDISRGWVAAV
jgi:hypothetical protein